MINDDDLLFTQNNGSEICESHFMGKLVKTSSKHIFIEEVWRWGWRGG
jgi:hypothetical protein